MNKFENPYLGCEKDGTAVRVQTFVRHEDYQFLKLIRTNTGTVTISINTLFKKFVDKLKSLGITDVTKREDFEFFVANCQIELPAYGKLPSTSATAKRTRAYRSRSAIGGSTKDSHAPNVGGATETTGDLPSGVKKL